MKTVPLGTCWQRMNGLSLCPDEPAQRPPKSAAAAVAEAALLRLGPTVLVPLAVASGCPQMALVAQWDVFWPLICRVQLRQLSHTTQVGAAMQPLLPAASVLAALPDCRGRPGLRQLARAGPSEQMRLRLYCGTRIDMLVIIMMTRQTSMSLRHRRRCQLMLVEPGGLLQRLQELPLHSRARQELLHVAVSGSQRRHRLQRQHQPQPHPRSGRCSTCGRLAHLL